MEVGLMTPSPAVDFNFDSASTSPYMSAPSSPPHRLGCSYYSAPASPASAFFYHGAAASLSAVPFNWEEKPGIPKGSSAASSNYGDAEEELPDDGDKDFAFDFSGQLGSDHSLPADELFDGGKIRPLKPPPRCLYDHNRPSADNNNNNNNSPKSPRSPTKFIREALIFSPKNRGKDFDPFAAALEQARRQDVRRNAADGEKRGRERANDHNPSTTRVAAKTKNSRSLSPYRVSDLLFEPDDKPPASSSSFWQKKWKIKDLLLFRSASESRAKDKDAMLRKANRVDESTSFRSTESVGSGSSRRRPGPPISAHELHYTMNRQFSEEMKRRTFLPYKQGLLGCLGFHPTVPDIPTGSSSRV